MSASPHTSVLLDEVIEHLACGPGDTVVDGTFGAGGYSRAILATGAKVVAFDRDPTVRRFAAGFPEDRFQLVEARFSEMDAVLGEGGADGVALDLGVSSMQINEAERGFSFMQDGPLDMRMGGDGQTAADLVNTAEVTELLDPQQLSPELRPVVEVLGDCSVDQCVLDADLLQDAGFVVVTHHRYFPRLRLELEQGLGWKADVEAALERLLESAQLQQPVGAGASPCA